MSQVEQPVDDPNGSVLLSWPVRLAGLAASLALVVWIVDLEELLGTMGAMSVWAVLLGTGVAVTRIVVGAIRWRVLDRAAGSSLGVFPYVRLMFVNQFVNLWAPTLGGDVARSALVAAEDHDAPAQRALSVLMDRMVGFGVLLSLGVLSALVAPVLEQRGGFVALLGSLTVVLAVIVSVATRVTTSDWLRRWMDERGPVGDRLAGWITAVGKTLEQYRGAPERVAVAAALTIPIHLSWFWVVYVFAGELGLDIGFLPLAAATCIVWVVTALPVSIGGLGVRELSYAYLLASQGVGVADAVALSAYQFVAFVLSGLIGAPFLWLHRRRTPLAEGSS